MPRELNGVPATNGLSHRFFIIIAALDKWLPRLSEFLFNNKAKKVMTQAFGALDPSWRLDPAPSVKVTNPVISDTLISHLRSGAVRSVAGIGRFTGHREIELNDGQKIQVDAVICCTGYKNDFSIIDPRFDPSTDPSPIWLEAAGSRGRPLPRLYQNVFSLKAPESLAFLGCVWFVAGAFCLADLASMCIAQVWLGNSALPQLDEMIRWADAQERKISKMAQRGTVIPASVSPRQWLVWADATVGAGVEEHTGWGWTGWKFWWTERRLYGLIMDGVLTSAVWRLFRGKRKAWSGARDEIERANDAQTKGRLGKEA